MDKMNCISNNHTIKNNGMQFVCEEDWKKSVKYVVKYSCLCECMRFRESVWYNQDMETKKAIFKDFVREKLLIPGTFKRWI